MSKSLTEFEQGILYAVAILQKLADAPVYGADILKEAGLSEADCTGLDPADKEALRVVNRESGMRLQGLET